MKTLNGWVDTELSEQYNGDKRLDKRAKILLGTLSQRRCAEYS